MSLCFVLLVAGCSGGDDEERVVHGLEPEVAAERARDALLTLMREKPALFEGTNAAELESFPIEPVGPDEFICAGFVINSRIMSYAGAIPTDGGTRLYQGEFRLEPDGRWVATDPMTQVTADQE